MWRTLPDTEGSVATVRVTTQKRMMAAVCSGQRRRGPHMTGGWPFRGSGWRAASRSGRLGASSGGADRRVHNGDLLSRPRVRTMGTGAPQRTLARLLDQGGRPRVRFFPAGDGSNPTGAAMAVSLDSRLAEDVVLAADEAAIVVFDPVFDILQTPGAPSPPRWSTAIGAACVVLACATLAEVPEVPAVAFRVTCLGFADGAWRAR